MFSQFIDNLKEKLRGQLPGLDAQFEMAHTGRERINELISAVDNYRPSAVLAAFYPGPANEPMLLLIERVTYNGHHSGQIALPGGKFDQEDEDLEATALREFFEETGSDITPQIIGKLTPIHIPVSKFMVHPYVGVLEQRPNFNINEAEVQQLIEWPYKELLDPLRLKQTTIEAAPGIKINTPYFDINGKVLWGATAMIVNELKWVLRG